ncbi:MAG: DUF5615 family PIN-like protein [Saprospiraceae bacterium]|nr:DUF5615 family PIN-like protein [Saprospiraceae bacterium]
MVAFLTDENFDNRILRGLQLRLPNIDIIRVQDTVVAEADDPKVLAFAFAEKRVLLSHDFSTIFDYFKENIRNGIPNPGVIMVHPSLGIGAVIDDLEMIAFCSTEEELLGDFRYLPL